MEKIDGHVQGPSIHWAADVGRSSKPKPSLVWVNKLHKSLSAHQTGRPGPCTEGCRVPSLLIE